MVEVKNNKKTKKRTNILKWFLIGGLTAQLLDFAGATDFVANQMIKGYDKIKTYNLTKKGTAYIPLFDKDGLDAFVLTNNTQENYELTQIPPIDIHNLYGKRCPINLSNLKQGHYIFTARIKDDLGNIEEKVFELNIKNKNEGAKSLYNTEFYIENKKLPNGKETFKL